MAHGAHVSVSVEGERTFGLDFVRVYSAVAEDGGKALVLLSRPYDETAATFTVFDYVQSSSTLFSGTTEDDVPVTVEWLLEPYGQLSVSCMYGEVPGGTVLSGATLAVRDGDVMVQRTAWVDIQVFKNARLERIDDSMVVVNAQKQIVDYSYSLTLENGDVFVLEQKRKLCCGGRVSCKK